MVAKQCTTSRLRPGFPRRGNRSLPECPTSLLLYCIAHFHIFSISKIVGTAKSRNPQLISFRDDGPLCYINSFGVHRFGLSILLLTAVFRPHTNANAGSDFTRILIHVDADILDIGAHGENEMTILPLLSCCSEVHDIFAICIAFLFAAITYFGGTLRRASIRY